MNLGKDFFKWFTFIVAVIKLLIASFGDNDEKDELANNHLDT